MESVNSPTPSSHGLKIKNFQNFTLKVTSKTYHSQIGWFVLHVEFRSERTKAPSFIILIINSSFVFFKSAVTGFLSDDFLAAISLSYNWFRMVSVVERQNSDRTPPTTTHPLEY